MYKKQILIERLYEIQEALDRIPSRFKNIKKAEDFYASEAGREHLDAICMVLLAVGEAVRKIDDKTEGEYLCRYPEIPWKQIMGIRHVLAHDYFDIDAEQIFSICQDDLSDLMETLRQMIEDMKSV